MRGCTEWERYFVVRAIVLEGSPCVSRGLWVGRCCPKRIERRIKPQPEVIRATVLEDSLHLPRACCEHGRAGTHGSKARPLCSRPSQPIGPQRMMSAVSLETCRASRGLQVAISLWRIPTAAHIQPQCPYGESLLQLLAGGGPGDRPQTRGEWCHRIGGQSVFASPCLQL